MRTGMTLRDWVSVVVLVLVAVIATHTYDQVTANEAAKTAATVVYTNGFKACLGANPTRAAQHRYFVTIAIGRTTSAKTADFGRPNQKAVDKQIARVAYATAKTYTDRFGARADGTLDCRVTTVHP
jgi:hypothetical protein